MKVFLINILVSLDYFRAGIFRVLLRRNYQQSSEEGIGIEVSK
jgi:hypothetical protein